MATFGAAGRRLVAVEALRPARATTATASGPASWTPSSTGRSSWVTTASPVATSRATGRPARFYARHGFTETHRESGGSGLPDSVWMERELTPPDGL